MSFYVPEPPNLGLPPRQKEVEKLYPQAASAIQQIMKSAVDIRFGSPNSEFYDLYRFQSESRAFDYFKHYLTLRHDKVDTALIESHVETTINIRPQGIDDDAAGTKECFEELSDEIVETIEEFNVEDPKKQPSSSSLLRFVVGGPGSGKTAFSKALFSVSLSKFWSKKIIPCRIEYSKIKHAIAGKPGHAFFASIRRYQLRDVLVFFVFSKSLTLAEKKDVLGRLALKRADQQEKLMSLVLKHDGKYIDGQHNRLTRPRQLQIESVYSALDNQQIAAMLYSFIDLLDLSLLTSLDGFDAVHIDDFFFEPTAQLPQIDNICSLLQRFWRREGNIGLYNRPVRAHFLIYLRDTSFERLKPSLVTGVGGKIDLPVNWIVPPTYEQLVKNAAFHATQDPDSSSNGAKLFTEKSFAAFDEAVFDHIQGLSAETHMSFVFGSNARRMKLHIVRTLMWALYRASQSGAIDFLREKSGISAGWLWKELVKHKSVLSVPKYLTMEELYLNESRQLMPTLKVQSRQLSATLDDGNLVECLRFVKDLDEVTGSYGCVLNYFLRRKMSTPEGKTNLPQLLILVRVIQFIKLNHKCTVEDIEEFVNDIGYKLTDCEVRLCLYILIRNHVVMWDSSTGAQSIDDARLYVTTKGRILIERLIYTVTYASEAFLVSLQCDKRLKKLFKERVFDSQRNWNVDCINNSSLYCYLIDQIESVELENASENLVDLKGYQIAKPIRDALEEEAKSILGSARGASSKKSLERHKENLAILVSAKAHFPELHPIGESHEQEAF